MGPGYSATLEVPRGPGTYNRMRDKLEELSRESLSSVYTEATRRLLDGVRELVALLEVVLCSAFCSDARACARTARGGWQ